MMRTEKPCLERFVQRTYFLLIYIYISSKKITLIIWLKAAEPYIQKASKRDEWVLIRIHNLKCETRTRKMWVDESKLITFFIVYCIEISIITEVGKLYSAKTISIGSSLVIDRS